jgi:hypothetical protein
MMLALPAGRGRELRDATRRFGSFAHIDALTRMRGVG